MHAERHNTGTPRLPEISRRGTDASPSFGDRSSGAVLLDLYRPYWRHLLSRHITTGLSAMTNRHEFRSQVCAPWPSAGAPDTRMNHEYPHHLPHLSATCQPMQMLPLPPAGRPGAPPHAAHCRSGFPATQLKRSCTGSQQRIRRGCSGLPEGAAAATLDLIQGVVGQLQQRRGIGAIPGATRHAGHQADTGRDPYSAG